MSTNTNSSAFLNNLKVNTLTGPFDIQGGYTVNGASQVSVIATAPTVSVTAAANVTSANLTVTNARLTVTGTGAVLSMNVTAVPNAANTTSSFTVTLPQRTSNFQSAQEVICSSQGYSGVLSTTNFSPCTTSAAGVATSNTGVVIFFSNNTLDPHNIRLEFRYTIG